MLPRERRLVRTADFTRVFRRGRGYSDDLLLLKVLSASGPPGRVGISVGRKLGGAVKRNRVKRLLREAARECATSMAAPADLVLVAKPLAASASYQEVKDSLCSLLRRARLRQAAPPAPSAPEKHDAGPGG